MSERSKPKNGMLILPDSKKLLAWNLLVAVATIYVAFEVPLRLIFDYEVSASLRSLDALLTLLFGADIVVRFNSAYFFEGRLVKDKKVIRSKYLKGGFVIDLLATIPYDLIIYILGAGKSVIGEV